MRGVSAPDVLLTGLRQTQEAHLSFAHQFAHRPDDIFNRHLGIDAMLKKQIDTIRPQPSQRALNHLSNVRRAAVGTGDCPVFDLKTELRGYDDLIAFSLQCASQQLFIDVRPIDLGGVEKVDT